MIRASGTRRRVVGPSRSAACCQLVGKRKTLRHSRRRTLVVWWRVSSAATSTAGRPKLHQPVERFLLLISRISPEQMRAAGSREHSEVITNAYLTVERADHRSLNRRIRRHAADSEILCERCAAISRTRNVRVEEAARPITPVIECNFDVAVVVIDFQPWEHLVRANQIRADDSWTRCNRRRRLSVEIRRSHSYDEDVSVVAVQKLSPCYVNHAAIRAVASINVHRRKAVHAMDAFQRPGRFQRSLIAPQAKVCVVRNARWEKCIAAVDGGVEQKSIRPSKSFPHEIGLTTWSGGNDGTLVSSRVTYRLPYSSVNDRRERAFIGLAMRCLNTGAGDPCCVNGV